MMRHLLASTAVFALAVAADSCFAQSQGLFGTQGPVSQGLGNQGTANSGLGALGAGAGGGLGANTQGVQLSEMGELSSQVGQSAFVGRGNLESFIGNRFAGQQSAAGQQPNFTAILDRGGDNTFQQQRNNQDSRPRIQPRYRIAFEYEPAAAQAVASRAENRLQSLEGARRLPADVDVQLDESGTAVLTGEVATADVRRLVENIVRLEPGVRRISNELVVAGEE